MTTTSAGSRVGSAVTRVLPDRPVRDLDDYRTGGLGAARSLVEPAPPEELIATIAASGLRGRGGAGFPTGRKWQTVRDYAEGAAEPVTVVVNGAEGEPGSFKDRMLMRRDPFRILDGALVAARAVGADRVVVALKDSFGPEIDRMRGAVEALTSTGRAPDVSLSVHTGPAAYLFGEETALLEVLDGRPPFPRVTPPFRRGVDDRPLPDSDDGTGDRTAARVELAAPAAGSSGIPTLVDNVETLAHAATIVAHGADWFRELGTDASPGTVVCTVSGAAPRHGVAEFAMGTTLVDVLAEVGDVDPGRVVAVMPGVSAAWISGAELTVPLTYEDFTALGSGLGTAGFVVLDRDDDLVAMAAEVARFLAVESCGQCTPCKQDGARIADALAAIVGGATDAADHWAAVDEALRTVADGARCALAAQHQAAVGASLAGIGDVRSRPRHRHAPVAVAPIRDLEGDRFVLDATEARKQPDWTTHAVDSGQAPADRLGPGAPAEPVDRR